MSYKRRLIAAILLVANLILIALMMVPVSFEISIYIPFDKVFFLIFFLAFFISLLITELKIVSLILKNLQFPEPLQYDGQKIPIPQSIFVGGGFHLSICVFVFIVNIPSFVFSALNLYVVLSIPLFLLYIQERIGILFPISLTINRIHFY